ncbi:cadmium-translocating P-type ATPase [Sphingomonas sp. HDW15A]|uniref:heavy metal translocating P-type ATPase n=1 Tax=Sphingomonas sp. HDW15A TaxID=2714942 RepID=UPI00140B52D4|nr:heavy metal translocating P-type ATPase [Sphingomonas sp. HDW15A]QIK97154.1 cadmium-translocating P-type ATPase [Sphingomonas sp. HDW15A]
MRCAACIDRIERGLAKVPGIAAARVNLSARRVRVEHDPALSDEAIIEAFKTAGFDAHVFAGEAAGPQRSTESRRLMLALAVAGFASMNIMLLSVSIWSGAIGPTRQLFHWISALIAIPTVVYSGMPFFTSAVAALRQRRTNMDVPISIGVIGTTAMSLYETATGGEHAYFDGAVMLLFFLLAGRFLDSMMRARAEDSVAALLRRVPDEATVLIAGRHERRKVELLAPGDVIFVAAGERIAVDGTIVDGTSEVDRALITGESLPERVTPGSSVLAGTINLGRPLTVRSTAVGAATAIADIVRLMEEASGSKSLYVRIADRAARLYAPAVHSLAALTLVGWLIAGAGFHQALLIAVAVLIITCPCALGLAVPIAQVVAAGALMRRGVLVKDGSALERLSLADLALLDKTGTATLGRLDPSNLPTTERERSILAALARASRHPLARSVTCALDGVEPAEVTAISEISGAGVEAYVDGVRWRFGRPDWVGAEREGGVTVAAFGPEGGESRLIAFADKVRPDARKAMGELKALAVEARLISGDDAKVVEEIATHMGIEWKARVTPAGKNALVMAEQAAGRRVLMVGDGLNDGPALKAADVAMAPAAASDVGQMAADLVFFGDSLDAVPVAVRAARRTMRVIKQNFALAIGYNVLAVPLAIIGAVTPLIAALAMSGSSILVVANALRLRSSAR